MAGAKARVEAHPRETNHRGGRQVAGKVLANSLAALLLTVFVSIAPMGQGGKEALGQIMDLTITEGCYLYADGGLTVRVRAVGDDGDGSWWVVDGLFKYGLPVWIKKGKFGLGS